MDMVVRVARAIAEKRNARRIREGLDDIGVLDWDIEDARAAIEALREPTDELREVMSAHARNGFVNWDDYHTAMIDAVLTLKIKTR